MTISRTVIHKNGLDQTAERWARNVVWGREGLRFMKGMTIHFCLCCPVNVQQCPLLLALSSGQGNWTRLLLLWMAVVFDPDLFLS